ncbi:hypothetical protein LJR129_004930 [Acidovorax sp. LjRoot129]|uniref:hypothetical protein n=1 Tax=unclassified Acidovorax TaxID=2684926 RepID=UPI003ECE20B2
MFSLIIAVVSIVLVVALVAASFYYGGDAMADGKKQADTAGLINQSQQIAAAFEMYIADNPSVTSVSISDLAPIYLTSVPDGWTLSSVPMPALNGYVAYPIAGTDSAKLQTCTEVNKKMGITGPVPSCSTVSANFAGCCTQ